MAGDERADPAGHETDGEGGEGHEGTGRLLQGSYASAEWHVVTSCAETDRNNLSIYKYGGMVLQVARRAHGFGVAGPESFARAS
ncbi:hypothetical protein [Sphaerisporangium sp. NPDC051011]|uniref:hypothetical protein n=1 Tax=Sphaerisporangium sp. NPDC051011 TaxID=3155792 RepID=UPI003404A7C4